MTTLAIAPPKLPDAPEGRSYRQTVVASGGLGGYTYSVTVGTLPAGLALNASTGVISGRVTRTGRSIFTIHATDGTNTGDRSYSVTVGSFASLALSGLIPVPQGTPFMRWASVVTELLSTYNIAQPVSEATWRSWAFGVTGIPLITASDVPDPAQFPDWRAWAVRWIQLLG
jgi:hypothetical protein